MSQILDAINKAEQQRQINENPQSRESLYHALSQSEGGKPNYWRLTLLLSLIILLAGAGFAAWKVFSPSHSVPTITRNTAAQPTHPEAANISPQLMSKSAGQRQQLKHSGQNEKRTPTTKANKQHDSGKLVSLKPIKTERSKKTLTQQLKPLTAVKTPARRPERTTVRKTEVSRETSSSSKRNRDKSTSSNTPAKSNFKITAIVYSPDPKQRFVFLNGQKIYEGQAAPNTKATVVKILPKQIIIDDGGGEVMIQ